MTAVRCICGVLARHGVPACRRGIPVRHDADPVFRGFLRPSGIAKARNSRMVAAMCEIMAQMGRSDGKLPLEIRKDRVYDDSDDRVTCRSRSGDRKPCPPPLAPRSDALRTLRNNYRQTQVTSNISRRIRGVVPRLIASPPSDFAARIKKPRPKARFTVFVTGCY